MDINCSYKNINLGVGMLDAENLKLSVLKGTDPQENTILDLRP